MQEKEDKMIGTAEEKQEITRSSPSLSLNFQMIPLLHGNIFLWANKKGHGDKIGCVGENVW